jgi:hypothetical protein
VRLLITAMWILGAILWLPWFALVIRLLVDVAGGTPLLQSDFINPALVGPWPTLGWGVWQVVSWYPVSAVLGMALVAVGWRIYWREQDFRLTRSPGIVALSIALPVVAPFIMLGDARRRQQQIDRRLSASLAAEVTELVDSGRLDARQVSDARYYYLRGPSLRPLVILSLLNLAIFLALSALLLPVLLALGAFVVIEALLLLIAPRFSRRAG